MHGIKILISARVIKIETFVNTNMNFTDNLEIICAK